MPLMPTTLANAIVRITSGEGFPDAGSTAAEQWARAVGTYFRSALFPTVMPGAHVAAEAAARGVLGGLLLVDAMQAVKASVQAYAGVLAGMPLAPGVATPPASPLVLPAMPPTLDAVSAAGLMAATIHGWAVTGLWIPAPLATPVPWS